MEWAAVLEPCQFTRAFPDQLRPNSSGGNATSTCDQEPGDVRLGQTSAPATGALGMYWTVHVTTTPEQLCAGNSASENGVMNRTEKKCFLKSSE